MIGTPKIDDDRILDDDSILIRPADDDDTILRRSAAWRSASYFDRRWTALSVLLDLAYVRTFKCNNSMKGLDVCIVKTIIYVFDYRLTYYAGVAR